MTRRCFWMEEWVDGELWRTPSPVFDTDPDYDVLLAEAREQTLDAEYLGGVPSWIVEVPVRTRRP